MDRVFLLGERGGVGGGETKTEKGDESRRHKAVKGPVEAGAVEHRDAVNEPVVCGRKSTAGRG